MPQNPTPIDQTHGYNANAAEAIAAMPRDEQGLPIPDETAFNNSQVIIGSDPEAKARSLEMERNSDKVSEYVQKASEAQQEQSQRDLIMGRTKEEVQRYAGLVSERTANTGVGTSEGKRLLAVEGGMLTRDPQTEKLDRSPASIRLSQEEINNKAIENAKKII